MTPLLENLEPGARWTEYTDADGEESGDEREAEWVTVTETLHGKITSRRVVHRPRHWRLGRSVIRVEEGQLQVHSRGQWLDDDSLFRYFNGTGGDQTEPRPLSEAEARELTK